MSFLLAANQVLMVDVHGREVDSGQPVINRFTAKVASIDLGSPDSAMFLDTFSLGFWQASVLPRLSNQYFVQDYTLKVVAGALPLTPTPRQPHPYKIVFSSQDLANGGPADVGALTTDAMPNYAAVSVRKVSTDPLRIYKGGARFSPIVEADTLPEGNQLTSTSLAAWQTATSWMRTPFTVNDSVVPPLNVASLLWGTWSGVGYITDPAVPSVVDYFRATSGRVVHRYLGSQISRKVPVDS